MTTPVQIVHTSLEERDAIDDKHVEALLDCLRAEDHAHPRARHPYEHIDRVDGDYDPTI